MTDIDLSFEIIENPGLNGQKLGRGAYFLANDSILDIAIAFLKSFRIHNPTTSLCLIPYDDDIEEISALGETFQFSVFSDRAALGECDAISTSIFGHPVGQFRKLCSFEGDFTEFVYIDCDTVVLNDVEIAFQFLNVFDYIASHSDEAFLKQWVWKNGIESAGLLSCEQIAFSANTGFFCSRKGLFATRQLLDNLPAAAPIKKYFELSCAEQPYINYIVVTSGCSYTSLKVINRTTGAAIPLERWGGTKGRIRSWRGGLRHDLRSRVMLIHWAGKWAAQPFDRKLYAVRKALGIPSRTPSVRQFIRHRWLWKYYRHLPYPLPPQRPGAFPPSN